MKKDLRKTILSYRRLLSDEYHHQVNHQLLTILHRYVRQNNFQTIHLFLSIERNKEVDVRPLINEMFLEKRNLITSKTNFDTCQLEHFYLSHSSKFKENKVGIPEPTNAASAKIDSIDLVLVPLTAVDKKGNRIGYGGGFYDRMLQGISAIKVGLSLSPLLDFIPFSDKSDVPLDAVITPWEIYLCKH